MNRNIKCILLADAKEGRAPKERSMQKDAEAAHFLDDLQAVKRIMQAAPPDTHISDFTRERIRAEARTALSQSPVRKPEFLHIPFWRPALVYASLSIVVLLLGVFALLRLPHEETGVQPIAALPEISVIDAEWDSAFNELVSTMDSDLDQLTTEIDDPIWLTLSMDADELAAELLMKGSDS